MTATFLCSTGQWVLANIRLHALAREPIGEGVQATDSKHTAVPIRFVFWSTTTVLHTNQIHE